MIHLSAGRLSCWEVSIAACVGAGAWCSWVKGLSTLGFDAVVSRHCGCLMSIVNVAKRWEEEALMAYCVGERATGYAIALVAWVALARVGFFEVRLVASLWVMLSSNLLCWPYSRRQHHLCCSICSCSKCGWSLGTVGITNGDARAIMVVLTYWDCLWGVRHLLSFGTLLRASW